ncbi:MAG: tetratricopeptide repeat protein [Nevskia sp.]|nr:tetratricopeptide repeat protein [Nevskia sp.]
MKLKANDTAERLRGPTLLYSALVAGATFLLGAQVYAADAPAAAAAAKANPAPAAGAARPADPHAAACAAAAAAAAQKPATISDDVFDDLKKATELLGQKKLDEAIAILNGVTDKGGDYDKALVNYNLGVSYSEKNDYANSAKSFAKALSYHALPVQQNEQLKYNAGQLYVASGNLDEGIKLLQSYVGNSCNKVTADAHMFLANALTQQKRFPEALQEVNVVMSKAKVPKESWLLFQLGIQYEMKDYNACADTLIHLISVAPGKSDYWKQLSGVLLQANDQERATAVLAMAQQSGLLEKPEDIRNLYSTYMMIGEPLKAARLVDGAIAANKLPSDEKTLEMVSDAWINARETDKAEDTLKKLAGMADRGEYYFRLGAMYGDQERWKESREMLQHALDKGGLKRPGDAWFRIAVADYGTSDIKGAISALQKAATYEESKQQATEWLHTLQGQPAQAAGQPAQPAKPSASAEQPVKVATSKN